MSAPITANDPIPGFYRTRLVKGGPWVAARVFLVDGMRDPDTGELASDQELKCEINGVPADAYERWTWLAGREISKAEYDQMMRVAKWAEGTSEPEGTPTVPVDLRRVAAIF